MMRIVLGVLMLLFVYSANAQDAATFDGHNWKAPYQLASPEGWGIERFLLPAGFAPEIKYKGVEDIRFAPGWAKKASEDYWSYLFLWYLDGDIKLTASDIGQYLRDYYTGLISVNGSAIPKEKIIPVETSVHSVNPLAKDQHSFQGTVTMTDYMQQQKMVLNVTIHVLACKHSGKTYIIHQLSPQSYQHGIWKRMDAIREQFVCADKN
jgi:hypothetical protein